MFYISTKFGFVSAFHKSTTYEGEPALKAHHCIDVREALPFATRSEAEREYKRMGADWWHCIVCSGDPDKELTSHIETLEETIRGLKEELKEARWTPELSGVLKEGV